MGSSAKQKMVLRIYTAYAIIRGGKAKGAPQAPQGKSRIARPDAARMPPRVAVGRRQGSEQPRGRRGRDRAGLLQRPARQEPAAPRDPAGRFHRADAVPAPSVAGASYNPVVRRLVSFSDEPLAKVIKAHEKQAEMLLELDERVAAVIARLKARGFVSPYLRAFVIARINPLRWIKGEPPPLEEVLKTMRERAGKFNTDKVKQEDLAGAGGAPDEPD